LTSRFSIPPVFDIHNQQWWWKRNCKIERCWFLPQKLTTSYFLSRSCAARIYDLMEKKSSHKKKDKEKRYFFGRHKIWTDDGTARKSFKLDSWHTKSDNFTPWNRTVLLETNGVNSSDFAFKSNVLWVKSRRIGWVWAVFCYGSACFEMFFLRLCMLKFTYVFSCLMTKFIEISRSAFRHSLVLDSKLFFLNYSQEIPKKLRIKACNLKLQFIAKNGI
jgi:hypothetical protein